MDENFVYPEWVKDDIDKAIFDVCFDNDLSKSVICNLVKDKIISSLFKVSVEERVESYVEKGYIKRKKVMKEFNVLNIPK